MCQNSLEDRVRHVMKLMESFKREMGRAIGHSPMQAILNHPYPPRSRIPIPHEFQNHDDKALVRLWPEIERRILEWRKIVYLFAYVSRAHIVAETPCLERIAIGYEILRPNYEADSSPQVQALLRGAKALIEQAKISNELACAYEDQAMAYALENNDVHSREWYEKHASRYLPSPFVMMENMQHLPSEILIIAFPDMDVGPQRMFHHKEDDMDPYAIMTIRRALFNILPF
ncbi:hypothetical protein ABFS82_01G050400 [Erythranthe guttata]|uniref:Uncharacterized protein n=1 Tax=Erythranthe guttata TaxID=4155 RepID=A0A022RB00_ERYGU|nr:PREDICTED: uncharacterized protein LOC105957883 [Erythranthe guttata]EYU37487.1 hypothetical protein MIMGU_mgv1a013172mg [Erythranthe guttata]|eukprot:XP_012837312.1 PREDICTED: uncharacterized protein LOC105957883 [Erythranthe guttata]